MKAGSDERPQPSKDWGPDEITGTVIRQKPAGRQALPSLWRAEAPVTQDEASKENPAPAVVVPPTVEPQEANNEQLPGNGKTKKKSGKKKKKENVTTQETSTQGTSSQTTEGESANLKDTTQATKEESQPAPEAVAESKTMQTSQDEPKKGAKKKKKPAKRGSSAAEQAPEVSGASIESAPVESGPVSGVPIESAPIESADIPETATITDKNESVPTTTTAKRYRADAGGSLHVHRQRYKPAVRNIFVPPADAQSISEVPTADNIRDGSSSTSTARPYSPERQQEKDAKSKEQTRKKIHGSFGNLDVGFNPWPRAPSGEVWSPTKRPPPPVVSSNLMKRSLTPQPHLLPPPRVIIEPAPAVDSSSSDTVATEHAHGLPTPTRVAFKDAMSTASMGLGEEIYAARSRPGSNKKPSGSSFVSMAESQYTTASSYHSARSTLSSGEHSPPPGATPPASP